MTLVDPVSAAVAAVSRQFVPGLRLALALSGGIDSVVLLHALAQRREQDAFSLSAIHVHHGLMAGADAWADFCVSLCRDWQIPLVLRRVQVARDGGQGLEAAAREARYREFAKLEVDALALGQHRDDQAETVLLNLLRGAGVHGAAAMPQRRWLTPTMVLLRPLLALPRSAIEAYAQAHGLQWVEDDSNRDVRFGRNLLRHEILPRFAPAFTGASVTLARAAEQFAEAASLLDDLARLDRAAAAPSGAIDLARLAVLSPERARNLVRFELARFGAAMPDARRLAEAVRQLRTVDWNNQFELKLASGTLHAWRGQLHFDAGSAKAPPTPLAWQGQTEIPWAGAPLCFEASQGEGLSAALMAQRPVSLRVRSGGERLCLHQARPNRSLKNLFQESTIPPWLRPRLPQLWIGESLAWVAGLGVDVDFRCPPGEAGWRVSWQGLPS